MNNNKINMATQTRGWSFVSLFIIVLVLSLPFYTAQVYATPSIQITKNEGDDHVPQFIDAQGDTWTVEATITGAETSTINPQDVKIRIGGSERTFGSCNPGALGIVCQYLSPLPEGFREAEYTFQVLYSFINELGVADSVSRGDVIKADRTPPQITGLSASQAADGNVNIRFSVKDDVNSGVPASGLKTIEILDEENALLAAPQNFQIGDRTYDYTGWEGFSGEASEIFSGEGVKRIKVRATDRLNHRTESNPVSFRVDFVAPQIHDNLELGTLGRFIGEATITTDVTITIIESSDLSQGSVTAESLQATFPNSAASCADDPEHPGDWTCTWSDVEVQPEENLVFTITATDRKGNTVTRAIPKTEMVKDVDAPRIEFFGTDRVFQGETGDISYLKNGENRIILRINEDGSGISKENIRANLGSFGRTSQENPDECTTSDTGITQCVWNVQFSGSTNEVRMGLTMFKDNVENEGSKPEILLVVDNSPPQIEKLLIKAYSPIAGDHEYFQSNDVLKISFTATERSGINILVDENDAVLDAENRYKAGYKGVNLPAQDGIQVFKAEDGGCVRDSTGEKWNCVIETDQIKSGTGGSASIGIEIQDTVGNVATLGTTTNVGAQTFPRFMKSGTNGKYNFELLGLSTEEAPDFWEVKKVKPIPERGFVDLDAAAIAPATIPMEVQLKTDNTQVSAIDISLVGCAPVEGETAPELAIDRGTGGLLYASVSAAGDKEPKPKLILEFQPFNGRELFNIPETEGTFTTVTAKYTCQFRIFSKVGREALLNAEFQDVLVEVPFGFTSLGAIDENLGRRITELRENDLFEFANAVSYLNAALKWIDYVTRILNIIVSVNTFVDLFSDVNKDEAVALEKTPFAPYSAALRGACLGTQTSTKPSWGWVNYIQTPLQILTCNPEALDPEKHDTIGVGWYYYWQNNILDVYNIASGRDLLGFPAESLYDNMYTSAIGLCVPGIVYNVNKAREIHCRKIVCYGREVPAGLTTIDACNDLYDLQMCEYVWGPVLDFTPLGGFSYLGKLLKTALTSPVGLINILDVFVCGNLCFEPTGAAGPGAITACKFTTGVSKVLGIINSVVSAVNNRPYISGSPYCDMAEDIDIDELTTVR